MNRETHHNVGIPAGRTRAGPPQASPGRTLPLRPPAARRGRGGFTLVEMLAVVTILLLLALILFPTAEASIELSRRARCASNFHQLGTGIQIYATHNRGRIMRICNWTGTTYPYPGYIRWDNTAHPSFAGEWAVNQIKPYVDSYSASAGAPDSVYGVAMCPSVNQKLMNKYIQARNVGNDHKFFEYPYAYWGGVNTVDPSHVRGSAFKDLAKVFPAGGELLMSDVLYFDASDAAAGRGFWRYNHGPKGWAFNEVDWLPQDASPVPTISGINRLFIDGSVRWKAAGDFPYLNQMRTPASYSGGAIQSQTGNCDTFYY